MEINFTKRSFPDIMKDAGVPGKFTYTSEQGGRMMWILPDGTPMTPGEAAKKFLPPCAKCQKVWPHCPHN